MNNCNYDGRQDEDDKLLRRLDGCVNAGDDSFTSKDGFDCV